MVETQQFIQMSEMSKKGNQKSEVIDYIYCPCNVSLYKMNMCSRTHTNEIRVNKFIHT